MKRGRWFLAASLAAVTAVLVLASGVFGDPLGGLYRLSGLVGQMVAMVRASYVEEAAVDRLELGAMNGLVTAGDPGGAWIGEGEFAAFAAMKRRPIPAFGVVLGVRSSYPIILQVLPGSPGEAAGLSRGELLESADGEVFRGRPLWHAEMHLDKAERGGDEATVEVIDRRLRGKRAVVLRPGAVKVSPPLVEERDGVLVVRPVAVDTEAVRSAREALNRFGSRSGIVVDVRGVALGDRQGAADFAAAVAGGDVEIALARRDGSAGTVRSRGPVRGWAVVVCVDATTAAAGEVLAAALKRSGATLVGGESYGDTGERRAVQVREGKLWLAETWCEGPDGVGLMGRGLKPDDVVRAREGEDPILTRALEIARDGAARKAA